MKQIIFLLMLAFITATAFTSCRKCVTCKAIDRTTNITDYEQKYCGIRRIVDDQVDTFKAIYNDSYTRVEYK
jgi:hypothetical protein